jgi:hypothetical protein
MKAVKQGTVQAKVLDYLKTGHSLDLLKATALFGMIRLSDAVMKLRKKGYPIETVEVEKADGGVMSMYRFNKRVTKDTPEGTKVRTIFGDVGGIIKSNGLQCGLRPYPVRVLLADTGMPADFDYKELEVCFDPS